MSPSTFAELRNDQIAKSLGAKLPELYWPPRQVTNGLRTCRGVVIGGAIAPRMPELSADAERIQEALLEPRTATRRPLLNRIAGALWAWC